MDTIERKLLKPVNISVDKENILHQFCREPITKIDILLEKMIKELDNNNTFNNNTFNNEMFDAKVK